MNEAMTQDIKANDDEISFMDMLQVVVENLRLLVLVPLVAGLLALGYAFTIAPIYTATTRIIPPQQQSGAASLLAGLGALGGLAGATGVIKSPTDQYIAFLKSRSIQDALIDRFGLLERFETKFREDARTAITGLVQFNSGKDGLITINASAKDPGFAAQLANAHVEELGKLLNRLALTDAQQRRSFFEKQLSNAKDNLVKSERALKSSGVNSSALKAKPEAAIEGLAKLKAAITAQEVKLASMRGYLTDSATEIKQAQNELFAMRSQMVRIEETEPPSAGGSDSDYIAKFRDFKYHEALFELFSKQYEMARVDESREGAAIQVVDPAIPPERKSKPKKAEIAILTTLGTSFTLLLFVFARQAFRNAIRTPEFARKFTDLRLALAKTLGRTKT